MPSALSNPAAKIAVDLDDEEVGTSKGKKVKKALKKIKDVERPASTQSRRDTSDDELLSMIED